MGLVFGLAALAGLIPVVLAFVLGGPTIGLLVLLVVIVYWVVLGILASAAIGILRASLYRFATTGKVAEGFPEQVLRNPGAP